MIRLRERLTDENFERTNMDCNEREHNYVTNEDDGRGTIVGFGVSDEEG
jgi:hypothetical protein